MVKVYLYRQNKVVSVFAEEAETLISKELACYPDSMPANKLIEEKAINPVYENKMVSKPKQNKRARN